jgi:hypothetical protein
MVALVDEVDEKVRARSRYGFGGWIDVDGDSWPAKEPVRQFKDRRILYEKRALSMHAPSSCSHDVLVDMR